MNDAFLDIWKKRKRIVPEVMKNWIDNDWAKCRNESMAFLIKVKDRSLVGKIKEIQDRLAVISCVDPFPRSYFHITVKSCGFLSKTKTHKDDVTVDDLLKIIKNGQRILQNFSRFDACLSKLNIFQKAIFIEVHDGGRIRVMNRALRFIPQIETMQFDYPNFLPHLSIAQFRSNKRFTELLNILEKLRMTKFGIIKVDVVELIIAHLNTTSQPPRLESVFDFSLTRS